ncbi:MAG: hypothetical protein N2316_12425 [Spirochaetes bacterium]|nr:hypothetical protein [Spirochaetota bacterium]
MMKAIIPIRAVSGFVCALLIAGVCMRESPLSAQTLHILLTSNIEGRSSISDEDTKDFLLKLGSSITHEMERGNVDLYIDLGNGFYPGALSRFSMGAVVMDFFDFFQCTATLISSKDIRIGINNLEFLQLNKKTKLLSANIVKKDIPVFEPFVLFEKAGKKIGFVGLSSRTSLVDIAEKNIFEVEVIDHEAALDKAISKLKSVGVDYIVLLSGMSNKDMISVLEKYTDIDLAIVGGDNTGELYEGKLERIDLANGKQVVYLADKNSYYHIELNLDKKLAIKDFQRKRIFFRKANYLKFKDFSERLSLWKKEFSKEGELVLAIAHEKGILVDDIRIGNLLRHKFNAEVAILGKDSIKKTTFRGEVRKKDIIEIANDEFPLFQYYLTGAKLSSLLAVPDLHFCGVEKGLVQGYSISPNRHYRIISTQTVFDKVKKTLKESVPYNNLWLDITELVESDLKNEKALLKHDYGYLERRFRTTLDIKLSNFFDILKLAADVGFSVPGGPTSSYRQWGLENDVQFVIYNRYHRFLLNPYLNYLEMRKEKINSTTGESTTEKLLIKNLLRGIFEYKLNYFLYLNPYHKSQIDTVLKRDDDGNRPAFIREIIGANLQYGTMEGKIGTGFERKINDPKEEPIWGFEAYFFWKYNFLKYFTYSIKFDSFIAKSDNRDKTGSYIRSELTNALEYKLTSLVGISYKHRWYFYKTEADDKSYDYKQSLVSFDIKTDFKTF